MAALNIATTGLTLKGHFDPKWVDALFQPFGSPSSMSMFMMKDFMELDNEVIFLSNRWIWYE
jgi:hypothetical protein